MNAEAATGANMPTLGNPPLQLTRRQLYDLVWDTPIDVLAARYEISNVGLAKICRRFDVPVPPRGYWQKFAAGIKVPRSKLSASRVGDDVVVVTLSPRTNKTEPEPVLCAAIREQRAYEDQPEHKIVVVTPLAAISRVHPLVRQTATTLCKAKMIDRGLIRAYGESILDVQVCKEQIDRAMCVMDALIKGLEMRGFPVACRPPRPVHRSMMGASAPWHGGSNTQPRPVTCVKVDDQDVLITIREHRTRIDLQKAAAMSRDRKDASTLGHIYPRYDFVGSGRLILSIQHHIGNWGNLAEWRETATHRLDDMLNDVIVGVVGAAEEFRELLAYWANQERERIDQAERAREEQRLRDIETARVRVLEEQATDWCRARQIREYIAAVRAAGDGLPTAIVASGMTREEWFQWAEAYVRQLDPMC